MDRQITERLSEQAVRGIVQEVLDRLGTHSPARGAVARPAPAPGGGRSRGGPRDGVYEDAAQACAAAAEGFLQLREKGVEARARVVRIIKDLCVRNARQWGRLELEETRIGRLDHKIQKLEIIEHVPGVEWLRPDGFSGDHGITLEEFTPFGVVGAITPVTHSIPTIAGNIISIVAAGNSVVFNPHPAGAGCAAVAVRVFNEAIKRETGIENLVTCVEKPSLETFNTLCGSDEVAILVVTGGPGVVAAAMQSGKRSICAGPGNPPVVVDGCADLAKAARSVVEGGGFDNNLLCIGEKEVFVLKPVYEAFMTALEDSGARRLNAEQLKRLSGEAFSEAEDAGGCSRAVLNRELVGADARVLAHIAGIEAPADCPLLFAETDPDDRFVVEEQMMPMVPVVAVDSFSEGVRHSVKAERGYKHSSMVHTLNVDHMTEMARAMDSTLFVKNGSSICGLGLGGEGYLSYSIATATGEGITTPKTFTRVRRCVMVDNLRIY